MSNYAIGDIQGCFLELKGLLDLINFDPAQDRLWFVGDLINRGPDSLRTIEFIYKIKHSCNVVLGNHDIHFLAIAEGIRKPFKTDTLNELLKSEHLNLYKKWLRDQNLLYYEDIQCEEGIKTYLMTHAGIPPHWSWQDSLEASQEIKESLIDDKLYKDYLSNIYGNFPNKSDPKLTKLERMRLNTNYFTRMRFCKIDGELELDTKGASLTESSEFKAWFNHPLNIKKENLHLIFGHWAALGGETGLPKIIATDTGCVWGYKLSAYRLEDSKVFSYDRITK
tara:strand:+ start:260 stop:1099 length:840 start_codon:yes stop_codon:yes gene_type:complete